MDLEKYRTEADKYFGKIPKTHNCAQSVAAMAGRLDLVAPMEANGGGRAEGGLCGALAAVLAVTPETCPDELTRRFAELVGSTLCREIKSSAKTPCRECVAVGAALADEFNMRAEN